MIDQAFILAAGFGTRMRPLTNDTPKPLVDIKGRTLLDHTLDHLVQHGVKRIVINTHYKAEKIQKAVKTRTDCDIILSHENDILDTGGGLKHAIHYLKDAPFFTLSGDSFWQNPTKGPTALEDLEAHWNDKTMDILMLLEPTKNMTLTKPVGDYEIQSDGQAVRSLDKSGDYMFTSIRLHHPRIFENQKYPQVFSYIECMDKAQKEERLFAIPHQGTWHHISTPEDLSAVEGSL